MTLALITDLGGTKARFQLLRLALDPEQDTVLVGITYPTASARGFEELVARFIASEDVAGRRPDLCVCAVCGPVIDGEAYCASAAFEAPWCFDEAGVRAAAGGARTVLINDFVAVGHALSSLRPEHVHVLHTPTKRPAKAPEREPVACVGPGTGLGNVFCVWDEHTQSRRVLASEGGMSEFVPKSQAEWEYNEWLRETEEGGYVSIGRVVSGQGIASWYAFLRSERGKAFSGGAAPDPRIDAEIEASAQPAGVIAAYGNPPAAAEGGGGGGGAGGDTGSEGHSPPRPPPSPPPSDPLCVLAIDRFLDTLGAEAGNLAMRYVARGGVYIAGGGICKKLLGRLLDGRVTRAYLERGPASEIVEWCPLYVSDAEDLGLAGAKAAARALAKTEEHGGRKRVRM